MTEGVPLIIPEVNPEDIGSLKAGQGGIVANPNCSTIIALMAATPIHKAVGIKRMVISTYQVFDLLCNLLCFLILSSSVEVCKMWAVLCMCIMAV